MHRFTHLGRPIDLRHVSNRQAVVVSLVAGVVGLGAALAADGFTAEAWRRGLVIAGGSFLAWALGRELDPDIPATATAAAVASIGTSLWIGPPGLLLMAGVLLAGRILLRPTGHPPRVLDRLGILGLGVLLGARPGGWGIALVLAFAVARDRQLPGAPPRWSRATAALIAAGATALAVRPEAAPWMAPTWQAWILVAVGFVAGVTTAPRPTLASRADLTKAPLEPRRLASARRVTLAALVAGAAAGGQAGIVGVAPAWLAMVAVALAHRGFLPESETGQPT